MKKVLLLCCSVLLLQLLVQAQTIRVLYERKLNLHLDNKVLVEHHLSAHPKNPNHLLLSGMYIHPKDSADYGDFSIISEDNGKTWKHLKIFGVPEAADPWAEITPKGTAVYTALGLEHLFVYRSPNAGKTWDKDSINLGKYHDHQTIAIDEIQNLIYIVSIKNDSVFIAQSADEGLTYPVRKAFRFSNLAANTMTPVVLSDSTLLIPYSTFQRRSITNDGKAGREFLKNSLDWVVPFDGRTASFGLPMFIGESCERGFPVMAADKSETATKDRLYYVCSNHINSDILLYWSDTKGRSWSSAIPVAKYKLDTTTARNRFTGIPQVIVNNKGVVGIVWQSRIDDTTGKCQYLYFTASTDGGKTFSKPVRVSGTLSCQEHPQNSWAGTRFKSGGDYIGFITKPDGKFQVTWADSRHGLSQLYMSEIEVQ